MVAFALACSLASRAQIPSNPTRYPFISAITQAAPCCTGSGNLVGGDFNEDNKTDFVLVGVESPVDLALSNGDGTFTWTTLSNLPYGTSSVAVVDLNKDGHQDLVGAVYSEDGTSTYFWTALGNGDGSFQSPSPYTTSDCSPGYGLYVADFNGDGQSDVILSCFSSATESEVLKIYFGDGRGGFSSPQPLIGSGPIVVGDFNGDGISDYAAFVENGNRTQIFLGNSSGVFTKVKSTLPVPYQFHTTNLITGDFNGDGKLDLVVQLPPADEKAIIYFGNGDGTFTLGPRLPTSVVGGVASDLNSDGHLDIVALDSCDSPFDTFACYSAKVVFGRGDGTFRSGPEYFGNGGLSSQVLSADLKGDGKADLVLVNPPWNYSNLSNGATSVLLGNGDGTFEGAHSVLNTTGEAFTFVAVGDFNNDNKLDFVYFQPRCNNFNCSVSGTLSVVLGNGNGTFQAARPFAGGDVTALAVGDFNNDGNLDLVVGTASRIELYLGAGDGTLKFFSSCQCGAGTSLGVSIGVADFNNDGNLDLEVVNFAANTVSINFGDGEGHFRRGTVLSLASSFPLAAASNGEIIHKGGNDTHKGGNDVVTTSCNLKCDDTNPGGTSTLFLNQGNGKFKLGKQFSLSPFEGYPNSNGVGDFNQDGKTDLVINSQLGELYLFLGNGDGTFQAPKLVAYTVPGSSFQLFVADFNGDGKLDVVTIGNNQDFLLGEVDVLLGRGDGTFAASSTLTLGGYLVGGGAVGDFNGDGAPDVLENLTVLHLNSGGTYIQFQSTANTALVGAPVNLSATITPSYQGVLMPRPTGKVTFIDLSAFPVATLASAPLVNGTAIATVSTLSPGIHVIEPIYSGDSGYHRHVGSAVNVMVQSSNAPPGSAGTIMPLQLLGRFGGFGTPSSGAWRKALEGKSGSGPAKTDIGPQPLFLRSQSRSPWLAPPMQAGLPIAPADSTFSGFEGLDSVDNFSAAGNPDVEPPDQGLAVSETQVLEAINDAVALYDTSGSILSGPISLNRFFGLRPPDPIFSLGFGPFLSDPRVLYDPDTQRWFVTAIEVLTDPANGNLTPHANVLIAVSTSSDARESFKIFKIDVTDTGFGTCPCLGDHPNIAINHDGLFISTNQYSFVDQSFQTVLVLALDKYRLAQGIAPPVVGFQDLSAYSANAFALAPAQSAPGDLSANGTEYFLSSADQISPGNQGGTANTVTVWALSNTASLSSASPVLTLQSITLTGETYAQPVAAIQKHGPTPLRDFLTKTYEKEPFEKLDQDDDRFQAVSLAQGLLFGVLSTSVFPTNGGQASGVAWFSITPTINSGTLSAVISDQGYISLDQGDLLYPATALNSLGQGAITFSMSGATLFPGVGYVTIQNGQVGSSIMAATMGFFPEDGFTGYLHYGGNGTARWGDYSAATVDPGGDIWFAGEYIPGSARTDLADWGTFIGSLKTH